MLDVLDHARKMRETAAHLLHDSRILEIVQQYGTPHITGSYRLDVMYGADIDITVVTPRPQDVSRAVLQDVLNQGFFQRYEFGDFVRFPAPLRPCGYILVLAITMDAVYWEIEIWFLFAPSESERQLMVFVQQHLTPPTRATILALKHERHTRGIDKQRLPSVAIYYGVLREGARTLEDIGQRKT